MGVSTMITSIKKKSSAGLFCIIVLLLTATAGTGLFAQDLPEPQGYVNDFAGVISSGDASRITEISAVVEKETGAQIAVVTVPSIAPYATIEQFSIELAETWGVGQEGEDNGVVLVLAMEERKFRIEVGYGLEGAIPDGLAGEIMDKSMLPAFRNGNYSGGMLKGVEAVAGIIADEYEVDLGNFQLEESRQYTRTGGGESALRFLVPLIIFIFIGGGRFFWPLLFLSGVHRRGSFGGGFGAGSSSGGFSGFGGGGGFGGGSFGGGGASRGF